jgi:C4-dicarboxylate-specific signal transduction histidine kinase
MAFSRDGLAKLGTANSDAGSAWLYKSADAAAAVTASDYFLSAINEMKLLDVVYIIDTAGVVTISFVKTNNGTTIDLASGTAIADV